MRETVLPFDAIQTWGDDALFKVQVRITQRAEKELGRILAKWHKRYPRHSFRAAQAHGMLRIEVSPPIGDMTRPVHHRTKTWDYIDRIPSQLRIGAIGDLFQEAEQVVDGWNKLEWRSGTCESDGYISAGPDREVRVTSRDA